MNRVTVLVDPRTGLSKCYGYMEFVKAESVELALGKLNCSLVFVLFLSPLFGRLE